MQLKQLTLKLKHFETVMPLFPLGLVIAMHCIWLGLGSFSASSISCLQMVAAVAYLLTDTQKYDHISHILASFHWLSVHFRIDLKIILITFP